MTNYPIISNSILPKRRGHSYSEPEIRRIAREARTLAKSKGEMYYNDNIPCKRGHNTLQYTKNGHCIECAKLNKAKHRGKYDYKSREYYAKNVDKIKVKERHLKYGISKEQYENMLITQNNKCAICNKEETAKSNSGKIRLLAVDHCAITKKIRGLLCFGCNIGLGYLKHNPEFLRKAAVYCEAT